MREELLKGLNKEQIAKVKACRNQEELLALAKAEGVNLSEEQLAAVNGGSCFGSEESRKCPNCGSTNIKETHENGREAQARFDCLDCGATWYLR